MKTRLRHNALCFCYSTFTFNPPTAVLATLAVTALLQLMFATMEDKVLVCSGELPQDLLSQRLSSIIRFYYQLLARYFSSFGSFGTPREDGETPVDWVEGVAVMVAVTIVVSRLIVQCKMRCLIAFL